MAKLINTSNIPLSMACWLASNTYDFSPKQKSLSATDLNKSLRQVILRNRVNSDVDMLSKEVTDIQSLVKSKMGTAIHDAIENTWNNPTVRSNALRNLGYPDSVINRIQINPEPEDLTTDSIPVYMELRKSIVIDGYTISGKFDFVAEGKLTDFKSTGTWKWAKLATADNDFRRQGSIYKLIHKDIITNDHLEIVFLFTDWSAGKAKASKNYPIGPVVPHQVLLWSTEETTRFIKDFIAELEHHKDTPEPDLPYCSEEQLWQSEPIFKYFKNPTKMSRATKVFETSYEAQQQFIKDGAIGIVNTVWGEAKACHFCSAYNACTQKDKLLASGALKLN